MKTKTPPNGTEQRAIGDTHRHPWGKKMQSKIEERGLLDPKKGFPQTNALDLMAYREVFDLEYAMPIQRKGGITLSLMTNGGEVEWLARDLLQGSTVDGLKFFNDEYVDIRAWFRAFRDELITKNNSRDGGRKPLSSITPGELTLSQRM